MGMAGGEVGHSMEERKGCQSTGELWGLSVPRLQEGSLVGVLLPMGGATDAEAPPPWSRQERLPDKAAGAGRWGAAEGWGDVEAAGRPKCLGNPGRVPAMAATAQEKVRFSLPAYEEVEADGGGGGDTQ